ncbi:MAG: hypothetical protein RL648_1576 [Verrucomicrobiota bacterium]|jgi:microcompartment protein CcmK/EutM
MKFARIIGRVTLSMVDSGYSGPRFLLALPVAPDAPAPVRGKALPKGNAFVLYDDLGATEGDLVAYTDGGEAAAPFSLPTPCDAYNAAILDQVNYMN